MQSHDTAAALGLHDRGQIQVRLRGIDRGRYDNDEMCMTYWGIGAHLGSPWAQNAAGHVLGDVTDQGKRPDDPTSRGNEIGGVKLPFHCDGSDLVGLLCLDPGADDGLSRVANAVSLHNLLVREHPTPPHSTSRCRTTIAASRRRVAKPSIWCRASTSGVIVSSCA